MSSSETFIYSQFNKIKSNIKSKHLESLMGEDNCSKIIFNGDGGVGKTNLIFRLSLGYIPDYVVNMPHGDTPSISYSCGDKKNLMFNLWEPRGQEEYDTLRPLSYPETDLFCLCFSIASKSSFENIENKWIPEMKLHKPNTPIILMGCKSDLRSNAGVTFNEGESMAISTGCCTYVESSALNNEGNILDLPEIFIKTIYFASHQKNKTCHLM